MKTKIIFGLLTVFLLLHPIIASAQIDFPEPPKGLTVKDTVVSTRYIIFHQNDLIISFEARRPSKEDGNIILCIPGAFTSSEGQIIGLAISNGEIVVEKVNYGIGGALEILEGKAWVVDTDNGRVYTDSAIQDIATKKGSVFQQYQIVKNGIAESFRDKSLYQRRAIVVFADARLAVIQSEKPLTLRQFSEDLVKLGARDALYTDMGSWSEGWYRDINGNVIIIGNSRSKTDKQTNWLIFKK